MEAAQGDTHILYTKLTPPRLPAVIARERLMRELDGLASAKLALVVAGAGFGKTTLAVEFVASRGHPFIWYQLEESDRDPAVFAAYLAAALRRSYGGFEAVDAGLVESPHEIKRGYDSVLTSLLSEVERRLDGELFIVLDDFHLVDESPDIKGAVEFIIDHLPDNLHLMILSCREPHLELSRPRARRSLVEIGEEQLCFQEDETVQLFQDIFSSPLSEEEARSVTEVTEGWISGIVLLYHALKNGKGEGLEDMVKKPGLPPAEIMDYFTQIVYQNLDRDTRDFLLETSVLSRLDPEFCDAFLGIDDSRERLSRLSRAHLFTSALDEEGDNYRYHHLLQAFLQARLEEKCSPEDLSRLHSRAASLWEDYSETEEALKHYLQAGDFQEAARLLEESCEGWIRSGRVSSLGETLAQLPDELLREHPRLPYKLALTHEIMGLYDRALREYAEAAELFSAAGEDQARVDCLRSASKLSVLSGRAEEAERILPQMMELMEKAPRDSESWYEALAMLGAGTTYLGLVDQAAGYVEQALAHVEEIEDENTRALVLNWCGYASLLLGDCRKAADSLGRARRMAESGGLLFQLPYICCLLSFSHMVLGDFEAAKEAADRGLECAGEIAGEDPANPAVLQNLLAKALSLSSTGDMREALEQISLVSESSEGIEDSWLAVNCQLFAGIINLAADDYHHSLEHFRRAELLCRENGFKDDELLSRLSQLALTTEEMDVDSTRQEAESISEALRERGVGITLSPSYLLLASVEYSLGEVEAAREALEAALAIDEKTGSVGWWTAYSTLLLPVIAEEFSRGEHLEFLSRVLGKIGPASLPFLHPLKRSGKTAVRDKARELIRDLGRMAAQPLRIRMLGTFELIKGDKVMDAVDWRSKKALTVLKYLAARHSRGAVQRDELMELLWPGKSPDSASKNLNMALTALRKTLDPEAEWGDSQYLVSDGNVLQLELGEGGWIDSELFSDKLDEAEAMRQGGDIRSNLRSLLEAEELYRGEFLADDPYEDWCRPVREELERRYLGFLEDIADTFLEAGDRRESLLYLEKAVLRDPGREVLYRKLMILYDATGDKAGVERTFERCCSFLRDNYEVNPSTETMELYRRLHAG